LLTDTDGPRRRPTRHYMRDDHDDVATGYRGYSQKGEERGYPRPALKKNFAQGYDYAKGSHGGEALYPGERRQLRRYNDMET